MTETPSPAPAEHRRRTSIYVLAFRPAAGRPVAETLDHLVAAAERGGLIVQGSYPSGGQACLVLRFSHDRAAVEAGYSLADVTDTDVAGVVTGLGVHRRAVPA